jgi:hypothetical protein
MTARKERGYISSPPEKHREKQKRNNSIAFLSWVSQACGQRPMTVYDLCTQFALH